MQRNIFAIVGFLLFVNCTIEENPEVDADIKQMIELVRSEFAPDKRVAWWDVNSRNKAGTIIIEGETNLPAAKETLLDRLGQAGVSFQDSIKVYRPRPALVNVSVCNIRSQPKHSAELATQSLMGTLINVYKSQGSWHYIQTPDRYFGWLDEGAFIMLTTESMDQWRSAEKLVLRAPHALVKSAPDQAIVSDLVIGNIVRKLADKGKSVQIALPDGRTGFVESSVMVDYARFVQTPEPLLESILKTARSFMGRPYLWGGTSARAMDCSGFTKTAFYLNGLELPRDASQQVHVGIPIETDTTLRNLMPGDFLFFGRKGSADQKEKITHVGIYLGDGEMIHASEMVRVQSLRRGDPNFAENRLQTLVRAKRMLQDVGKNGVTYLSEHEQY